VNFYIILLLVRQNIVNLILWKISHY